MVTVAPEGSVGFKGRMFSYSISDTVDVTVAMEVTLVIVAATAPRQAEH